MKKRKAIIKALSLILSLMMVVLVMPPSQALAATKLGDFECLVTERIKQVIVMRYIGSATELTLPEEIEGYKVDRYETLAFGRCKTLQKVTIPGGIKNVSEALFDSCTSLKEVVLNEGIESIERTAFEGCSALEKVNFPKSLKSIGERAFGRCEALKGRFIFENIENIGSDAFEGCTGIERIYIERDVNIGSNAFSNCKSLKYFAVFGNVSSIGSWAFGYCKKLNNVIITGKTGSIGEHAFFGCDVLKNITSEEIGSIGSFAIPRSASVTSYAPPTTASVFSSGNTILILGAGFLLGAVVTALGATAMKKKKKKNPNQ